MTADSFTGRLLPGERIIWSGLPAQGIVFTSRDILLIPFSLMWCGFAIFWEFAAIEGSHAPGFFAVWGAMFVCIGMYFVVGRFLVDAWVRRGTSYAVTDRRILIARSSPARKFIAINLAQIPDADLDERASGRGTIRFGPIASVWGRRQNMGLWSPSLDTVPQFIMIDDARGVFDLIQRTAGQQNLRADKG